MKKRPTAESAPPTMKPSGKEPEAPVKQQPEIVLQNPLRAGRNVLLAYMLSEAQESALKGLHLSDWYDRLGGPTPGPLLAVSVLSILALLATGLLFFRRMERTFADQL